MLQTYHMLRTVNGVSQRVRSVCSLVKVLDGLCLTAEFCALNFDLSVGARGFPFAELWAGHSIKHVIQDPLAITSPDKLSGVGDIVTTTGTAHTRSSLEKEMNGLWKKET